jgi:regulator of RNase E activity RraA
VTHKIYTRIDRLPADFGPRLAAVKTEIFPEHLPRTQIVDPAIAPLVGRDWKIAGPAVTVLQDRAGTFMSIAAMGVVQAGDIVVVAAQGDMSCASWGGGLTRSAKQRGVAAVVVDGAVLDTSSILARDVPVFCRGANMAHDGGDNLGSINVPVMFGGVVVHPGDYIVGDLDGIIVLPKDKVEEILIAAEEKTRVLAGYALRMEQEDITLFEMRGGRKATQDLGIEWFD